MPLPPAQISFIVDAAPLPPTWAVVTAARAPHSESLPEGSAEAAELWLLGQQVRLPSATDAIATHSFALSRGENAGAD